MANSNKTSKSNTNTTKKKSTTGNIKKAKINDTKNVDNASEIKNTHKEVKEDLVIDNSIEKEKKLKRKTKNNIKYLIIKLFIVLIFAYIFAFKIYGFQRMSTPFMKPNITEGDLLIYYRLNRVYNVGDIISVNVDGKNSIYRIIAKGGQTVDINETGVVIVDGYREEHDVYFDTFEETDSNISYPLRVGNNEFFVLNDYRLSKDDSRKFGIIKIDQINGKVIARMQIRNF